LIILPPTSGIAVPALATAVGLAGAAAGLWLTGAHRSARASVPFTAGILMGVALFGIVPEMAIESGWAVAAALFAGGYGVLFVTNRYGHPICPTCTHDHDHTACESELHGFGGPLALAAALHSFLDGWSIATAQSAVPLGLRVAAPLAVMLHKLPEGMALGGILRVSVKSRAEALGWCAVAEGTTMLGGVAGLWMAPALGTAWIGYPLGVAAGWLFYLGYHAVHEEWKRSGSTPAVAWAGAGAVSAALLQRGAEALLR
jgi:zinc transporter ZupT